MKPYLRNPLCLFLLLCFALALLAGCGGTASEPDASKAELSFSEVSSLPPRSEEASDAEESTVSEPSETLSSPEVTESSDSPESPEPSEASEPVSAESEAAVLLGMEWDPSQAKPLLEGFAEQAQALRAEIEEGFVPTAEGHLYDGIVECWLVFADGTRFGCYVAPIQTVPEPYAGCEGWDYGVWFSSDKPEQGVYGFLPGALSDFVKGFYDS